MRGCIFWTHMENRRPALVISAERRNQLAADVIVVPCSTTLRPMSWHVLLRKGDGGLPRDSMAKCEQLMTVPKTDLIGPALGPPLGHGLMRRIEQAVLLALGITL